MLSLKFLMLGFLLIFSIVLCMAQDEFALEMSGSARSFKVNSIDDLQAFSDAWNRHDIHTLMSFMSDREDVQFHTAAGTEMMGTSYVGADEVRKGFQYAFQTFPDAQWKHPFHFLSEDRTRGITESTFVGTKTNSDGSKARVEARMVDVFTFDEEGKILIKNAYRKHVPEKSMRQTE